MKRLLLLLLLTVPFAGAVQEALLSGIAINLETEECTRCISDECTHDNIKEGWQSYFPINRHIETINITYQGKCLHNFFEEDGCFRCFDRKYASIPDDCFETREDCEHRRKDTHYMHDWVCINATGQPALECKGYTRYYNIYNANTCYDSKEKCESWFENHNTPGACFDVSDYHPSCDGYARLTGSDKLKECHDTYDACNETCLFNRTEKEVIATFQTAYGACNATWHDSKECCEQLGLTHVEKDITKTPITTWLIPLLILAAGLAVYLRIRNRKKRRPLKRQP